MHMKIQIISKRKRKLKWKMKRRAIKGREEERKWKESV